MHNKGEGYMFGGNSLLKAYDKYPHDITCRLCYTVSSTKTELCLLTTSSPVPHSFKYSVGAQLNVR